MNVFISHISEESALASMLKDWIESTFPTRCIVFVSSDSSSLAPGTRWLEQMDSALRSAEVMIVLCSTASIRRPWVNFETGCAWSRGIPVIPICHSGVSADSLPRPLAEFQGLNAGHLEFPTVLLSSLGKYLGIPRLPRLDVGSMTGELNQIIKAVQSSDASTEVSKQEPNAKSAPEPIINLDSGAQKLLRYLSEGSRPRTAQELSGTVDGGPQKVQYLLDQLIDAKLIVQRLAIGRPTTYELSKAGRKHIFG